MSREIPLNFVSYRLEQIVSQQALSQIQLHEISKVKDFDGIIIEAVREVATWRADETLVVEWPANWWQHFKQRFFPQWARRRWPILFTTKTYRAIAYLPSIPVQKPEYLETAFYGWKDETP